MLLLSDLFIFYCWVKIAALPRGEKFLLTKFLFDETFSGGLGLYNRFCF